MRCWWWSGWWRGYRNVNPCVLGHIVRILCDSGVAHRSLVEVCGLPSIWSWKYLNTINIMKSDLNTAVLRVPHIRQLWDGAVRCSEWLKCTWIFPVHSSTTSCWHWPAHTTDTHTVHIQHLLEMETTSGLQCTVSNKRGNFASSSFDKHRLIWIIFRKRRQHS